MEIIQKNNVSIITPLSPRLDAYKSSRLFSEILNISNEVAINLDNVCDCTVDFIEGLRSLVKIKKIKIYNIPSDIFVIFNLMDVDKMVPLYTSELDFEEERRQLINRKFVLA